MSDPMRKRLLKMIRETEQIIRDLEWWNENRTDAEPFDVGADRVMLSKARAALEAWDSGDPERINATLGKLVTFAAVYCQSSAESRQPPEKP